MKSGKVGNLEELRHRCLAFAEKAGQVGDRLRLVREALGLTQESLAFVLNASKRGIQDAEARSSVPRGDTLAGLVGLGVNANWLLTGEGPEQLVDLAASHALGIDLDSLQDAIQVVEEGLTTHRRKAGPALKAELINEVYLLFVEEGVEAEAIRQKVVRLIRALAKETGEIDG